MMEEKLRRIELAFDGTAKVGQQATLERGVTVDGLWIRTGEVTRGLNDGEQSPEYIDTLEEAVGAALIEALTANTAAQARIAEMEKAVSELEAAISERDHLLAKASADLEAAQARIAEINE